ncbi:MAG: T9SS type A sorting domain-containing protein [Flavobacteriales bacterium]
MINRYASVLAILFSGASMAQVSLSVGNHVPVVGQTVALATGSSYTWEGPAGADVTVNYWDLFPSASGTRNFYYAAATSTMPSATLASTDGGSDTTFWSLSSEGLTVVGLRGSLEGVLTYTDPIVELKLPLAYGQSWTDAGTANYTALGFGVTRVVSLTGSADAYGTLNLPGGSTNDVLRVRVRRATTDNSAIAVVNRIANISYFYTAGSAHPVLRLSVDSTSTGLAWQVTRSVEYVGNTVTVGIDEYNAAEARFIAYPNPAHQSVTLQLNAPADLLQVFDSKGAMVRSVNTTSDKVVLDLQGVEAGHYLVRAYHRGVAVESRPLVVE